MIKRNVDVEKCIIYETCNVESDPDSQHKHTALSRGHIWLTLFLHIFVPYVISGNHGKKT